MKKSMMYFLGFLFLINFILIPIMLLAPVYADVPGIVNIEPWISGTETTLNITIRHSSPTSSHYIDLIQVDIDGIVNDLNLVPQSANPFIVEYSLGELGGEPSVRVRPHCNLHGWGGWSNPQTIPEFPSWALLPLFLTATLVIVFFRKSLKKPGNYPEKVIQKK